VNSALGIAAKILFFLEKIEAKSPPLSLFKKGERPNEIFRQIILFYYQTPVLIKMHLREFTNSKYRTLKAMRFSVGIAISFMFSLSSSAQSAQTDTIKIMSYNSLDYGFPPTSSCPALIPANKHGYLKTILRYENPDILGLVKMDASPSSFSTTEVVQKCLDSVCMGCYGHSIFTNFSGYSKENMLYFKTSKFGYVGTTTIYSGDTHISDINLHTLFYKDPNLSVNHDTTFIHIILIHDKSGINNASNRATEIGGAMSWLNAHVTSPGNYIFMGDFNTQSSSEVCFQDMINSSNLNARFYDPPNQLGDWVTTPSAFAPYLTENTRSIDPGDCGATGSLNRRFDHILCTQPIMQGTNSVQYIPGSFNVIGNDGNHASLALTDPPANTSVPPAVLNALYYMSNHLPISVKIAITLPNTITTGSNSLSITENSFTVFPNPATGLLYIRGTSKTIEPYKIILKNILGQIILEKENATINNLIESQVNVSSLSRGIYFVEIISKNESQVIKVQLY